MSGAISTANRKALTAAIPGAVEMRGSDSPDIKEKRLRRFADGRIRVLVTKPTIAGFGLNWQHCANMAFVGLSDSWEAYYQAVRRCWRFGQKRPVNVHVITADIEGAVVANIKRKEADAAAMAEEMLEHMRDLNEQALHGGTVRAARTNTGRDMAKGMDWTLHLGDCVEVVKTLADDSIHYSHLLAAVRVALYLFGQRPRHGQLRDDDVFIEHFGFLVDELYRVTDAGPAAVVSLHEPADVESSITASSASRTSAAI